jgi:hypothetical protein
MYSLDKPKRLAYDRLVIRIQGKKEKPEMICPHCHKPIKDELFARYLAAKGGKKKSEAKSQAARANGRKGGRPVKGERNGQEQK